MLKHIVLALISGAAFGIAGIGLKCSAQEWRYWDRQDRNDYYGPRYSERTNRDYYYDGPRASERSNRDYGPREYYGNYGPYYRMERPSNNRRRVSRPYPTYAYPFSYAYPVYVYPPLYAYPSYYPYVYPYAPYYYGIPAVEL
jgi:hypothetical protein